MPVSLFHYELIEKIYGATWAKMFFVPISITQRGKPRSA